MCVIYRRDSSKHIVPGVTAVPQEKSSERYNTLEKSGKNDLRNHEFVAATTVISKRFAKTAITSPCRVGDDMGVSLRDLQQPFFKKGSCSLPPRPTVGIAVQLEGRDTTSRSPQFILMRVTLPQSRSIRRSVGERIPVHLRLSHAFSPLRLSRDRRFSSRLGVIAMNISSARAERETSYLPVWFSHRLLFKPRAKRLLQQLLF